MSKKAVYLFLFCLLIPTDGFAGREIGERCSSLIRCERGLACAGTKTSGVCLPECDPVSPKCPNGEKCQVQGTGQSACVCNRDSECPEGLKCIGRMCAGTRKVSESCTKDKDCGPRLICARRPEQSSTRCLYQCKFQCLFGENCLASKDRGGVCFCYKSSECKGGSCVNGTCKITRKLGQECTDYPTCESGTSCAPVEGGAVKYCLPSCSSSKDCMGGEPCQSAGGQKVCMCKEHDDCPGNFQCIQGLCSGPPRCSNNQFCPFAQMHCVRPDGGSSGPGFCFPECKDKSECNNTPCLNASPRGKSCVCLKDSQCSNGQKCKGHKCISPCSSDSDCSNGYCNKGFCKEGSRPSPPEEGTNPGTQDGGSGGNDGTPLYEPAPLPDNVSTNCSPACGQAELCIDDKCVKKKPVGKLCKYDAECITGLCHGKEPPAFKICSVTCSKCAQYDLSCKSFGGKLACFVKSSEEQPKPECGCQSAPEGFSHIGLFFFLLLLIRLFTRGTAKN